MGDKPQSGTGRGNVAVPIAFHSPHALEAGTEGAAFLALAAGVPVVPVTITGSEYRRIENNLKKLRRSPVTVTVGKPFVLPLQRQDQDALQEGTRIIMETLARQLSPEYRGFYAYVKE